MQKKPLTVGDVEVIVKILKMQQSTTDDTAVKEEIDGLINKLYELKVGS